MNSVVADEAGERFTLTPEAAAVLATPDHPAYGMGMFHRLPQTMRALEEMPASFRSGVGHDYDSHGPQGAVGIERSFEPWNNANLLPNVLPKLEGIVERLHVGARVADIGCGFAFDNGEVSGVTEAITRLAAAREDARLMGQRGRTHLETELTRERAIDRYEQSLEKAARAVSRRSTPTQTSSAPTATGGAGTGREATA